MLQGVAVVGPWCPGEHAFDRIDGSQAGLVAIGVGVDVQAVDDAPTGLRPAAQFRFAAARPRLYTAMMGRLLDGAQIEAAELELQRYFVSERSPYSAFEIGFSVMLIPHTLSVTTLGRLQVGDPVNLETDLLAKYVERQLAVRSSLPHITTH